jgi:chromosome segregation ATPase
MSNNHWLEMKEQLQNEKNEITRKNDMLIDMEQKLKERCDLLSTQLDSATMASKSAMEENKNIEMSLNSKIANLEMTLTKNLIEYETTISNLKINHNRAIDELNSKNTRYLDELNSSHFKMIDECKKEVNEANFQNKTLQNHISILENRLHNIDSEFQTEIIKSTIDNDKEKELYRVQAEAEYTTLHERSVSELRAKIGHLESQLRASDAFADELNEELQNCRLQVQEEQTESAALRLRLQLLDSASFRHEIQSNGNTSSRPGIASSSYAQKMKSNASNDNVSNSPAPLDNIINHNDDFYRINSNSPPYGNSDINHARNSSTYMMSSPIFSEDFGPVSIPTSPVKQSEEVIKNYLLLYIVISFLCCMCYYYGTTVLQSILSVC